MGFWSNLFRRGQVDEPERVDQNFLAQMWDNYFTWNGNSYPFGYGQAAYRANVEAPPSDFTSYVAQFYKSDGIVFAACMARQLLFTEMRFAYQQITKGRPTDLFGAKELSVLEEPWTNGTTGDLLARALQDADLAGNHYVLKEYDRKTKKWRLRRLRPDWVDILLSAEPEKALKSDVVAYIYKPGRTEEPDEWEVFPVDGPTGPWPKGVIAHWTPVPDPTAQYRGMSWLTPIVQEILADKGASKHKVKFFQQGATPQLAVSFKESVSPEDFEKLMKTINSNHSGVDDAYRTMYLAGGADVTVVGSHLAQLDFRDMQGHVETRIAAASRLHPVLIGMSEALRGTPLAIGNYQAAKDMAGEAFLRPYWRSLCASYEVLVGKKNGARLWYDDRDVSFLRQDRQAQADLLQSLAGAANTLIMAGFTPESIVKYMSDQGFGDWNILQHSGLFSVQLQEPGPDQAAQDASTSSPVGGATTHPPKPKYTGNKSVTPVPKPPSQSSPPKAPTSPNQTPKYQNTNKT